MLHDVILFLVGIVVGVMNAIAGGGMLLGFPVLIASGMPVLEANATSPLIVLPGQLTSALGYRQFLRKVPRRYMWLALPGIAGGALGAFILRNTSRGSFAHLVPFLILLAVLLFAFQPWLHSQLRQHMPGDKRRRKAVPLAVIALATLPLAVYGGYFGPGFGFVMLALLSFTSLHHAHQINAMKNIMAVFIAGAAVAVLASSGLIDWHHGLVMALGNTIGGYVGARLALRFSSHGLRIVVIAIGFCTAGYLALRSY